MTASGFSLRNLTRLRALIGPLTDDKLYTTSNGNLTECKRLWSVDFSQSQSGTCRPSHTSGWLSIVLYTLTTSRDLDPPDKTIPSPVPLSLKHLGLHSPPFNSSYRTPGGHLNDDDVRRSRVCGSTSHPRLDPLKPLFFRRK